MLRCASAFACALRKERSSKRGHHRFAVGPYVALGAPENVAYTSRSRSVCEWPPVNRDPARVTRAGGSESSLRSPCPLAVRPRHRNPAAPPRQAGSGPLVLIHEEVRHLSNIVVSGVENAFPAQVVVRTRRILVFLQPNDIYGYSSVLEPARPRAGRSWTTIRPSEGRYKILDRLAR
jgi:hypothetical protein